jgi:hypothetical protein
MPNTFPVFTTKSFSRHHKQRTFEEEYRQLLIENGIDFDERYLL